MAMEQKVSPAFPAFYILNSHKRHLSANVTIHISYATSWVPIDTMEAD